MALETAVAEPAESRYLQSSRARDLIERHRSAFDLNAIPVTDPAAHPGELYLGVFASDVLALGQAVQQNFI